VFNDFRLEVFTHSGIYSTHEIEYNAMDLTGGIYFYRIEVGKYQEVKKMILMK